MLAIPAIDLRDRHCVQLVGGDYAAESVRLDDPVAVARRWAAASFSRLHVIDLDAATGRGDNRDLVRDLLRDRSRSRSRWVVAYAMTSALDDRCSRTAPTSRHHRAHAGSRTRLVAHRTCGASQTRGGSSSPPTCATVNVVSKGWTSRTHETFARRRHRRSWRTLPLAGLLDHRGAQGREDGRDGSPAHRGARCSRAPWPVIASGGIAIAAGPAQSRGRVASAAVVLGMSTLH